MYTCYRSHEHAYRTSHRHIPCFLSGSAVLEREIFMYYVSLLFSGRLLENYAAISTAIRGLLCLDFRRGKSWNVRENRFHHDFRSQRGHRKIVAPDHTLCLIFIFLTGTFSCTA